MLILKTPTDRNNMKPEQHENFTNMMQYLASEPEWNDGKYLIGKVL